MLHNTRKLCGGLVFPFTIDKTVNVEKSQSESKSEPMTESVSNELRRQARVFVASEQTDMEELAEFCGVTQRHLVMVLNQGTRNMSLNLAIRIGLFYGRTLSYILPEQK